MTSRVQLALNVDNLDDAINYYSQLFGTRPHKIRKAYANFTIAHPPLKLVLFENPQATERLNHLGIEVFEAGQVATAAQRLAEAGILTDVQSNETCCHATQDKVWSRDPQGMRWEWYRITDDAPEAHSEEKMCCSGKNTGCC